MIRDALALSILSMAAVFSAAWGQGRAMKLDCPAVDGLVSYCQLRVTSLPPESNLSVNAVNSNVSVTTWDGPDFLIRAEVETAAANQSLAEALADQVFVETSTGNIAVKGPAANSHQSWSVKLEIQVPPATGLTVATVNGGIAIHGVQGAIDFDAVNCNASLSGVGGDVTGSAVNGSVFIGVGGGRWAGQTLDVDTVNGSIEIEVPADCAAQVTASVARGVFSTNFPVEISSGSQVTFELGDGTSAIRLAASNGNIELRSE
jgi:DUF4097 and DUF4098 domain-containing protein YvlB